MQGRACTVGSGGLGMTLGDYRSRQRGSLIDQQVLEHAPLELLEL
jgi:hypothetical protein